MESIKIFEDSHKELNRIIKETSTDEIRIDLSKLDSVTKGLLLNSIRDTAIERKREIEKVILGVH